MQRTLVLWRHAKSAWDQPALPDIARPLAPRGHRAAPEMAGQLAAKHCPGRVICSPARRTVQTWQHLALRLPVETPVTYDQRIYEADWPDILAVVRECPADIHRLLVIGHNPGFEDLTAALAKPVGQKFATAAFAVLTFQGDWSSLTPGAVELLDFRRPKRKGQEDPDD